MRENPTGYETFLVDESGDIVRGPGTDLPTIRTAVDTGMDDRMFLPARRAVEAAVDPADHDAGTHLATAYYDVREPSYDVEFHVEVDDDEG